MATVYPASWVTMYEVLESGDSIDGSGTIRELPGIGSSFTESGFSVMTGRRSPSWTSWPSSRTEGSS